MRDRTRRGLWTLLVVVFVANTLPIAAAPGAETPTSIRVDATERTAGGPDVTPARVAALPPPARGADYYVTVELLTPDDATVTIQVRYPARNVTMVGRANNDTLDVGWFDGRRRFLAAMEHSGRQDVRLRDTVVTTYGNEEPPGAGSITVEYEGDWEQPFPPNRSEFVLGPGFAEVLGPGDHFAVIVGNYWWYPPESVNTHRGGGGETTFVYAWTIGEDPSPRIVFNRTAVERSVPAGPGAGALLAMFAVLLVALAPAMRRPS